MSPVRDIHESETFKHSHAQQSRWQRKTSQHWEMFPSSSMSHCWDILYAYLIVGDQWQTGEEGAAKNEVCPLCYLPSTPRGASAGFSEFHSVCGTPVVCHDGKLCLFSELLSLITGWEVYTQLAMAESGEKTYCFESQC